MSELIPMTELTDTELDAVCGGILDIGNPITQINTATPTLVNVLSVGGNTNQIVGQANVALFNSPVLVGLV